MKKGRLTEAQRQQIADFSYVHDDTPADPGGEIIAILIVCATAAGAACWAVDKWLL